jgi:uncharacterized membrane protein YdbT with pleckstrin-like domain
MNTNTNHAIVINTRLHWGIMLVPWLTGIPLVLLMVTWVWRIRKMDELMVPMCILLGLFFFLAFMVAVMVYLNERIVITSRSLTFTTGILALKESKMLLNRVENVRLHRPLLGRLMGYGTISVNEIGGEVFNLHFLPNPRRILALLQENIILARKSGTPTIFMTGRPVVPIHKSAAR